MSTQPNAAPVSARPFARVPHVARGYDTYDEAQKAVDYLSDHEFPVQNVLIVGTDLKQLERVTGRLTRGRVIGGRASPVPGSACSSGLIFALLDPAAQFVGVVATVAFGAVFGLIWALSATGSPAASATSRR